ncbi:MAG: amidohydrolase [Streptosporangiales bacterium]
MSERQLPTVVYGGPIHTFGPLGDVPALLLQDGRVAAAGTPADCRRTAATTPAELDLQGRTVLPGFVDPHVHPLLLGDALSGANLAGARSLDAIVRLLREHAGRTGDGVVTGYGYDQSKLAEMRHPTRTELDAVTTKAQVRIQHASGHGYVLNTRALRECNIDAGTQTPPGGRIDRDEDGEPTGLVFDSACDLLTGPGGVKIANHGPNFHRPLDDEGSRHLLGLAQQALLAVGVTTICDAQVTGREMRAYFDARDRDELLLRTHALVLSSGLAQLEELGLGGRLGDSGLELLGVKMYADGSVTARTAYLQHACGQPEPTGYLYHDPEELTSLIQAAHRLGLPTATHAQGELPIGIVLDAVAGARAERPRPDLVHRIEHCGFPTAAQIGRMAELGVVPVPQPMQVTLFGDSLADEYGDYGGRFYPTGEFARTGLPVVISSDGPVTDPDPLRAAAVAVSRETLAGKVAGGDEHGRPRQGIDADTALRAITSTPAAVLGCREVGSLEPGQLADLVVLHGDPVHGTAADLRDAAVTETWVGGVRRFQAH